MNRLREEEPCFVLHLVEIVFVEEISLSSRNDVLLERESKVLI